MTTKKVLKTVTIGIEGTPEAITLNPIQARFLLGLLLDPAEVAQIVNHLAVDCGLAPEVVDIAPTPAAPQPVPESPKPIAPQATTPTSTPKPEPKPKATRKPRRVKTPIVLVDVLAPISGISALPGIPLPSPTATCAVSRPSQTPNVTSGTGVEKIASASLEREATNERGLAELLQRAKEVGVTGAIHKMKADTLRARIALAEEKLATKAVPVPVQPIPAPVEGKTTRKAIADFVNRLPDGREVWTVVYDDGTIYNEISRFAADAVAA
jgi:hypothetical protein